ncbi:MAG: hypothetical protein HGA65_19530 [Oscillochloris sp.]|nr:hypothetical protein [Oscillochloris sp.]
MLFLTIILGLVGMIAVLFAWRGEGSIIAMRETETLSIAQVLAMHRAGRLGQLVEVVGTSECDSPLRSPYSETICLAYDYSISEELERLGRPAGLDQVCFSLTTGPQGRRRLSHNFNTSDQRVPRFYVRDASGRIAVDTEDAEMDLLETMARFESYTSGAGEIGETERQIWREEHALPLGNRVYILATLANVNGEPVLMRNPVSRRQRFIISHRDERSFLNRTRLRTYGLYLFSGIALGLALILIVLEITPF